MAQPTMRPIDEIPIEPYAEIVRTLLGAGATAPDGLLGSIVEGIARDVGPPAGSAT